MEKVMQEAAFVEDGDVKGGKMRKKRSSPVRIQIEERRLKRDAA